MSVREHQQVSNLGVIAHTADAVAVLRGNATETERAGRPTHENMAAVRAIGAFALAIPGEFGGIGANLSTTGRLLMALGAGCTSTAWVVGTGITSTRFAALGQRDGTLSAVFSDPDAVYCGSGAPTGQAVSDPDGVRVSGRWPIVSGCEVATTAVLGVMRVADDGSPSVFSVVRIPTSRLHVERTWDPAGLRGTGSHTVVADDVLVSSADIGAVSPDGQFVISSSVDVLAPLIGAAEAALALIVGLFTSGKAAAGKSGPIGESPGAQRLLAEATRLVGDARRRMLDVCDDFDSSDERSSATSLRVSAARVQLATAAEEIRSALDKLLDLHGVSAFASANPLQRHWRDVSVGTRHPLLKPYPIMGSYGTLVASPQNSLV